MWGTLSLGFLDGAVACREARDREGRPVLRRRPAPARRPGARPGVGRRVHLRRVVRSPLALQGHDRHPHRGGRRRPRGWTSPSTGMWGYPEFYIPVPAATAPTRTGTWASRHAGPAGSTRAGAGGDRAGYCAGAHGLESRPTEADVPGPGPGTSVAVRSRNREGDRHGCGGLLRPGLDRRRLGHSPCRRRQTAPAAERRRPRRSPSRGRARRSPRRRAPARSPARWRPRP